MITIFFGYDVLESLPDYALTNVGYATLTIGENTSGYLLKEDSPLRKEMDTLISQIGSEK